MTFESYFDDLLPVIALCTQLTRDLLAIAKFLVGPIFTGSGWVGQNSPYCVGRVGSSPVSNIFNKYAIYVQKNNYSTTIISNDKNL